MILREIDDKATFYTFILACPSYWPIFDKCRSEFELKFLLDFFFHKQINPRTRVPYLEVALKSGKPITDDAATAIRDCHNLYTSDEPLTLSPERRAALLSVREIVGWYWGEEGDENSWRELYKYRSAVCEEKPHEPLVSSMIVCLNTEKVLVVQDANWEKFLASRPPFPPYGCFLRRR